jgi:hypothetical protein
MELRSLRKHLVQLGECAGNKARFASVMTGERVRTHHHPVYVIGDVPGERATVAILQAPEDCANTIWGD